MNRYLTLLAACTAGLLTATTASADTTTNTLQRDVNQQQRISQGLQSDQLTTGEASRLERQETHINKMQSRAMKDGTMTKAETGRIQKAEDKVSTDIYQQKHDAQLGNSDSKSSQRMQADVQRNINQETRINNGLKSGTLTGHEASVLEAQQAHNTRREAHAGANGHVSAGEQARIQGHENQSSRKIFRKKHNRRHD